uniref:Uncharacterized protein n=1 Tax=Rhizophora mucronata TaxID=61149 RepID=A0A2P2P5Z4_RHIMU
MEMDHGKHCHLMESRRSLQFGRPQLLNLARQIGN